MIIDPWKEIRAEICYGNIEPNITLVAETAITAEIYNKAMMLNAEAGGFTEMLPACSASTSYGSSITSLDSARALNAKLISKGHLTPFESVQYTFKITGISKACGAQLSRHRIGQGHVSASRRYKKQEPSFVYPILDYIHDAEEVENIYRVMSMSVKDSMDTYNQLTQSVIGVRKQDARLLIPVNSATERVWWINARALMDFFRLRLEPTAEWEIRRLAYLLLNLVVEMHPSFFKDIAKKFMPAQKSA